MPENGKCLLVICQFAPDVKVLGNFIKAMTREHNLTHTIIIGPMISDSMFSDCKNTLILRNDQVDYEQNQGWFVFFEYIIKENLKFHTIFYQTLDNRDQIKYRYLPSIIHLSELKMVSPVETKRLLAGKLSLTPEKNEKIYASLEKTIIYEITNPTYIYNEIIGTIIFKLRNSLKNVLHLLTEFETQCDEIKNLFTNILTITNDLIDISNFSNNKISKNYTDFKLNSLIIDCVDCISKEVKEKNLNLTWEINPRIQHKILNSDYNKIKQLLLNILNNAIKFTHIGGIRLIVDIFTTENYDQCPFELDPRNKYIVFIVKDTGIGIRNEDKTSLNAILHLPSTQDENKLDGCLSVDEIPILVNKLKVKGLSMIISHHLSNTLDGYLWYKSERDVGSVFYFLLPL